MPNGHIKSSASRALKTCVLFIGIRVCLRGASRDKTPADTSESALERTERLNREKRRKQRKGAEDAGGGGDDDDDVDAALAALGLAPNGASAAEPMANPTAPSALPWGRDRETERERERLQARLRQKLATGDGSHQKRQQKKK